MSIGAAQNTSGLFAGFNRYSSSGQAAMGTSLLSSGSAMIIFLNPAGMQFLHKGQLAFTHLKLDPNLDQKYFAYAITKGIGDAFSVGIGGMSYSVQRIERYDRDAQYLGDVRLDENLYLVSLSTGSVRPFHIGASVRYAVQNIPLPDTLKWEEHAFAADYGFVYSQYDWLLLSVSSQTAFRTNDGERSLPRLRSSLEFDLPFFSKNSGAAWQMAISTQTEYGHWTTGSVGMHVRYPFHDKVTVYLNSRTPAFVLIKKDEFDTNLGYFPMEEWGLSCGIIMNSLGAFKLKFEFSYITEKYFNQQISTIELMR